MRPLLSLKEFAECYFAEKIVTKQFSDTSVSQIDSAMFHHAEQVNDQRCAGSWWRDLPFGPYASNPLALTCDAVLETGTIQHLSKQLSNYPPW